MQTVQKQMEATLAKTGIPARKIHCYGSQIMITALSQDAAQEWGSTLAKFATVNRIYPSIDETLDAARDPNRRLAHTVDVWMVWATI